MFLEGDEILQKESTNLPYFEGAFKLNCIGLCDSNLSMFVIWIQGRA